jgi:hypothetical protein
MIPKVRTFICICLALTNYTSFSQKHDFGLVSQLDLANFKKNGHLTKDDLLLHQTIDSLAKTKSYLSKSLLGKGEKLHISLHTNLTIEAYLKPIKLNTKKFTQVNYWVYKGVHFTCLEFTIAHKKINRIIYQEPKLTTIVVLDYLQDLPVTKSMNKLIIKGLSFRTSA